MSYAIVGQCFGGDETPRFDVVVTLDGVAMATIESDGRGGCARVLWLTDVPDSREALRAWFAAQARRLDPDGGDWYEPLRESAILVVPTRCTHRRQKRRAS